MSIFDKITSAIHAAAANVGTMWHEHVEPWLSQFLGSVAHAEINAIVPIAQQFVDAAVPAAVAAIRAGDVDAFLDAQWDAAKATAAKLADTAQAVALTSVATAVGSLLVSHPDVVAATDEAKAAPAP